MENKYVIVKNKGVVLKNEVGADEVIREISTKEELEELIERMPYIQTIQAPNNKIRKEFYQIALESYDVLEWVKIIKSVYLRVEDNHYEEFELDYLEKARAYLYEEISIMLGIPIENVESYINDTIQKQMEEF